MLSKGISASQMDTAHEAFIDASLALVNSGIPLSEDLKTELRGIYERAEVNLSRASYNDPSIYPRILGKLGVISAQTELNLKTGPIRTS